MTKQEVFDKVARHLLAQGEKSQRKVRGVVICAYRGWQGMKCAAGVCIDDEQYRHSLEGRSVVDDAVKRALEKSGIAVDDLLFLISDMQEIHDILEPHGWPGALRECAFEHDLSPAVLDQ